MRSTCLEDRKHRTIIVCMFTFFVGIVTFITTPTISNEKNLNIVPSTTNHTITDIVNSSDVKQQNDQAIIKVITFGAHHKTGEFLSFDILSTMSHLWFEHFHANTRKYNHYLFWHIRSFCSYNDNFPKLSKNKIVSSLAASNHSPAKIGSKCSYKLFEPYININVTVDKRSNDVSVHTGIDNFDYNITKKLKIEYIYSHLIRNPLDTILSGYNYHKQLDAEKWEYFQLSLHRKHSKNIAKTLNHKSDVYNYVKNENFDFRVKTLIDPKMQITLEDAKQMTQFGEYRRAMRKFRLNFDVQHDFIYFDKIVNDHELKFNNDNDNTLQLVDDDDIGNEFENSNNQSEILIIVEWINDVIDKYKCYHDLLQNTSIDIGLLFEFLKFKNNGEFETMYQTMNNIKKHNMNSNLSNYNSNMSVFNIKFEDLTQHFNQTIQFLLEQWFGDEPSINETNKKLIFEKLQKHDIYSASKRTIAIVNSSDVYNHHVTHGKFDKNAQIDALLANVYVCKDIKMMCTALDYDWKYDRYC